MDKDVCTVSLKRWSFVYPLFIVEIHLTFKLVCRHSTQVQTQTNNDRADSGLLIVFENGARVLAIYRENNAIPQEQNLFHPGCHLQSKYSL